MPGQKQLKWSELRVGATVIFASLVLVLLLFLMSGTGGFFTKRITLTAYFDNAGGLRIGAPVRLSGVDIGNVAHIKVVNDKNRRFTPVEITMKVTTKYNFNLRKDSYISLATAGVLGETYLDIDSSQAIGALAGRKCLCPGAYASSSSMTKNHCKSCCARNCPGWGTR